ncbi:hypothetical protein AAMO2058_000623800 [Amorphochlora amoebiformis]
MDEKLLHPLDELLNVVQTEVDEKLGNKELRSLRIPTAEDFRTLDPEQFKLLKEKLLLYSTLPKAPTTGAYEVLASRLRPKAFKEQFEDTWTTANLTYAAVASLFAQIHKLQNDQKLPAGSDLLLHASYALLCASHTQARSLQHYRYQLHRTVVRTTPRPGSGRTPLATPAQGRELLDTAKTQDQLARQLQHRGGNRSRGRGRSYRGRGRRPYRPGARPYHRPSWRSNNQQRNPNHGPNSQTS